MLKGVVIDENLNLLHETSIVFDSALLEFRTQNGIIKTEDEKVAQSPTLMWVKALDKLLENLMNDGADFSRLAAVSGCAQHGTVYWKKDSESVMNNLDPHDSLNSQIKQCFTMTNSPTWIDYSTSEYCRKLEEEIGGPRELRRITGSRAHEGFSGPQIAKIAHRHKSIYEKTERISLISSFIASLFLGKYAPIDLSDGSGMNLLDIREKKWSKRCLEVCGPNLAQKLGHPVPSDTILGPIDSYFVRKYTMHPNCRVVAFTGENSANLLAMGMKYEDVGLTLGTPDKICLWLREPKQIREGHISINPLKSDDYMAVLCFKNGSLMREKFRNLCPGGTWEEFGKMLDESPRGNSGNVGMFFDNEEIVPRVQGEFRFDESNSPVEKFDRLGTEIRALIEGQFIIRRVLSEDAGFKLNAKTRILVIGGDETQSKSILQVIADVYNAPVYCLDVEHSTIFGSAYMAKYAFRRKLQEPVRYFQKITSFARPLLIACSPNPDADQIYTPMVSRYRMLIDQLITSS